VAILRHNKNEEIAEKVKDGTADVWITDNVEALFWAKQIPGLIAVNPAKTFTVGTKGYMIRQGDQIFFELVKSLAGTNVPSRRGPEAGTAVVGDGDEVN
jgi:ABC-type amino acid transport substrate-binding protein